MITAQALQQIASKLLAQSILEVFPGSWLIEGAYSNALFHYDAILPQKIEASMLCLLEEKMRRLIKTQPELRLTEMMRQNAAEYFRHHDQPLIAEEVEELEDALVPILQLDSFKDCCNPDDLPEAVPLFYCDLLDIAHQRIDDQWITQITGAARLDKGSLKAFVKRYRSARKQDHRAIGQALKLYMPLAQEQWAWLPRGEELKNALMQVNLNSVRVQTPSNLQPELLNIPPKRSFEPAAAWHAWLYSQAGEESLRVTECAQKTDPAKPSRLNGMLRNRTYTSDITHCFCPAESMQKELIYSLQLLVKIIKIFGFEVQWNLRTRRSHSTVNAGDWDAGVKALRAAAQTIGLPVADVEAPGPMQGPRLEALFQDALGQVWSGSFIQIDCCHPRLLKLSCEGKGKHAGTPKMIALSVWGSLERMAALLVENHPGMPQWPAILAEVQRKITSINEESISPIES